jgi:GNAT superfamily N-acetyltransferase
MAKKPTLNEISIANLADDVQHVEEASRFIWEEWHKASGSKLEDTVYGSMHCLNKDRVPQMYIAKHGDDLVGVASVWNNDLASRQDLSPWLATVYVKEEYRNIGIGRLLQAKCIQAAKELGYGKMYLITDLVGYYERFGWVFLGMAPTGRGGYIRLYEYEISQ